MELLELKKEHIENLINMCRGLKMRGVKKLDFTAFDTSKIEEYSRKAKEQWGSTPEYKEFVEKSKKWTKRKNSISILFNFLFWFYIKNLSSTNI